MNSAQLTTRLRLKVKAALRRFVLGEEVDFSRLENFIDAATKATMAAAAKRGLDPEKIASEGRVVVQFNDKQLQFISCESTPAAESEGLGE